MSASDNEPFIEVRPGDVTISDEGRVQIINVRLAEAMKAAMRLEREEAAAKSTEPVTNKWFCGLNISRCGTAKAAALLDEASLRVDV
jgi:hypothetical protein